IDTCYIDKSSSAELQEAINSMFTWYRDSYMLRVSCKCIHPQTRHGTIIPAWAYASDSG
ncbi:hypothetical protein P152DRAFT_403177, partial [Eremomyces bilateralis CBS 781.70]